MLDPHSAMSKVLLKHLDEKMLLLTAHKPKSLVPLKGNEFAFSRACGFRTRLGKQV